MLFFPLNKLPFFTSEDQKFLMILLGLCRLSWLSKILPYILLLVSQLKDSKWRMTYSLEPTRNATAMTTLYLVHILYWLAQSLDQLDLDSGSQRSVRGPANPQFWSIIRFGTSNAPDSQAEGLTREHILAKGSRPDPNNYSQCGHRRGTKSFLCDPILSNRRNPISMEDTMSLTKWLTIKMREFLRAIFTTGLIIAFWHGIYKSQNVLNFLLIIRVCIFVYQQ